MSFKVNKIHITVVNMVFICALLGLAGCSSSRIQAPKTPPLKTNTVTIFYDKDAIAGTPSTDLSLSLEQGSDNTCLINNSNKPVDVPVGQSASVSVTNLHDASGKSTCVVDMSQQSTTHRGGLTSSEQKCTTTMTQGTGFTGATCDGNDNLTVDASDSDLKAHPSRLNINDTITPFKIIPHVGSVDYLTVTAAAPTDNTDSCFDARTVKLTGDGDTPVDFTFATKTTGQYTCSNQLTLTDTSMTPTNPVTGTATFNCERDKCQMVGSSTIETKWSTTLNGGATIKAAATSENEQLKVTMLLPSFTINDQLPKGTTATYSPKITISPLSNSQKNACYTPSSPQTINAQGSTKFSINDQNDSTCTENIQLGLNTKNIVQITLTKGGSPSYADPTSSLSSHLNLSSGDTSSAPIKSTVNFINWNQQAAGDEAYMINATTQPSPTIGDAATSAPTSTLTFKTGPLPFPLNPMTTTAKTLVNKAAANDYPDLKTIFNKFYDPALWTNYQKGSINSLEFGRQLLIEAAMMQLTKYKGPTDFKEDFIKDMNNLQTVAPTKEDPLYIFPFIATAKDPVSNSLADTYITAALALAQEACGESNCTPENVVNIKSLQSVFNYVLYWQDGTRAYLDNKYLGVLHNESVSPISQLNEEDSLLSPPTTDTLEGAAYSKTALGMLYQSPSKSGTMETGCPKGCPKISSNKDALENTLLEEKAIMATKITNHDPSILMGNPNNTINNESADAIVSYLSTTPEKYTYKEMNYSDFDENPRTFNTAWTPPGSGSVTSKDTASLIPGFIGGYLLASNQDKNETTNRVQATSVLKSEMGEIDKDSFDPTSKYAQLTCNTQCTASKPAIELTSSDATSFLLAELALAAQSQPPPDTKSTIKIAALKTRLNDIYTNQSNDIYTNQSSAPTKLDLGNIMILGLYIDGAFNNTWSGDPDQLPTLVKSYNNPLVQYDLFNWSTPTTEAKSHHSSRSE